MTLEASRRLNRPRLADPQVESRLDLNSSPISLALEHQGDTIEGGGVIADIERCWNLLRMDVGLEMTFFHERPRFGQVQCHWKGCQRANTADRDRPALLERVLSKTMGDYLSAHSSHGIYRPSLFRWFRAKPQCARPRTGADLTRLSCCSSVAYDVRCTESRRGLKIPLPTYNIRFCLFVQQISLS